MPIPILLVDDDPLYREVMTAALEERGYVVTSFADGPALLAALEANIEASIEGKLALIDWTLPLMSGLELLHALRQRGWSLPVAFLTGRSPREREAEARAAGAVDFIDKTADVDDLVGRLARILGVAAPG